MKIKILDDDYDVDDDNEDDDNDDDDNDDDVDDDDNGGDSILLLINTIISSYSLEAANVYVKERITNSNMPTRPGY